MNIPIASIGKVMKKEESCMYMCVCMHVYVIYAHEQNEI